LANAVGSRVGKVGIKNAKLPSRAQQSLADRRDQGRGVTFAPERGRGINQAHTGTMGGEALKTSDGHRFSVLPNK